eukprot:8851413-Lingulodinium_polyedra.AAC.1
MGESTRRKSKGGILESKVWSGFRILTGEWAGFREWNTKFKNAFSQARLGARKVFEELEMMAARIMKEDGSLNEEI